MFARVVFFVLLLGNLAAGLAIAFGMNAGPRRGEPERLQAQLQPDKLRLPGEQGNAAASDDATQTIPACLHLTGLSQDGLQMAQQLAEHSQTRLASELTGEPTAWWVNLPPAADRGTAEQRLLTLRNQGIKDMFIVPDNGPDRHAISLGLFKNEAAANGRLDQLRARGIADARITPRGGTLQHRVTIRGETAAMAAFIGLWATRMPDTPPTPCSP